MQIWGTGKMKSKVSYVLAEWEISYFFDAEGGCSRINPRWIDIVQALKITIDY